MGTRARLVVASIAILAVSAVGAVVVRMSGDDEHRVVAVAEAVPSNPPAPLHTTVTFDTHGDTVDLVDGWYLADRPMAPELVNPRELLSLGTFSLDVPPARPVCVGNAPPATPVAAMGPDDVYLWLVEWYPMDARMPQVETSPPRPAHFVVEGNDRSCVRAASPNVRGGSFQFTDRSRVFSLYYVIGNDVSGDRARLVEQVLDSLGFAD